MLQVSLKFTQAIYSWTYLFLIVKDVSLFVMVLGFCLLHGWWCSFLIVKKQLLV